MDKLSVLVGAKTRAYRKKLGWTQEELAARAGMDFTSIGAAERGVRNLSLNSLARVAEVLGVDLADLLRVAEKKEAAEEKREMIEFEWNHLIASQDLEHVKMAMAVAKHLLSHLENHHRP